MTSLLGLKRRQSAEVSRVESVSNLMKYFLSKGLYEQQNFLINEIIRKNY